MPPFSEESLAKFLLSGSASAEADRAMSWVEQELGIPPSLDNMLVFRAVAAVKTGAAPEAVARFLDWKDFEAFCAALLRARGFRVLENVTMTKPRGQVDLVASSPSLSLVIDCKHWSRTAGGAALSRAAEAQAKRADLLRRRLTSLEPMVAVILLLSSEPARYVGGAAVVPICAFGDFLDRVDAYCDGLPRH